MVNFPIELPYAHEFSEFLNQTYSGQLSVAPKGNVRGAFNVLFDTYALYCDDKQLGSYSVSDTTDGNKRLNFNGRLPGIPNPGLEEVLKSQPNANIPLDQFNLSVILDKNNNVVRRFHGDLEFPFP